MAEVLQGESGDGPAPVRRGVWAVGLLGAGLVCGRGFVHAPVAMWLVSAAVLCLAAALGRGRVGVHALGAALVLFGAGWFGVRVAERPRDALGMMMAGAPEDAPLLVRGVLTGTVRRERPPEPVSGHRRWSERVERFDLSVRGAQVGGVWVNARGVLRVSVWEGATPAHAGDTVEIAGRWRPDPPPANPGQRNPELWRAQDGVAGALSVDSGAAVVQCPEAPTVGDRMLAPVRRVLAAVRTHAAGALSAALRDEGPPHADDRAAQSRALLRAMLIGQEDPELRPVSEALARLGIVHILSISGFHLVLGAMVIVWLVRLTGDRGRLEALIAGAGVVLYVLVVPPEAPIIRSALMILALLVSEGLGRRYDRLNTLGWIACVVLIWRPLDLWSVGFQLSFGVTAALLWRGRAWQEAILARNWLGMPGVKGRVRAGHGMRGALRRWVAGAVSTAALAWVVSTPVVIWHTGMVSLLGMLGGLVLTLPATGALVAGFLALLTGVLGPWASAAAGVFGWVAEGLAHATVAGGEWLAHAPLAAARWPQMPVAWALCATAVSVALIAPGGARRWGVRVALAAVLVWAPAVMWRTTQLPNGVLARVDRFALADSGALLVRSEGDAVLVNPGSAQAQSGVRAIHRAVLGAGGWKATRVFITTPEPTAMNHVVELVEPLGVREVFVAPVVRRVADDAPDSPSAALLRALQKRGVRVTVTDDGVTVGAARLRIVQDKPVVEVANQILEAVEVGLPRAQRVDFTSDGAVEYGFDGREWKYRP